MSWSGIGENIISDILFLLLSVALGWAIFFFFNRNRKLGFFGIKEHRRIVIYVANLRIIEEGALGIDNVIRSYTGYAVTYQEMVCANQFRDFFNYLVPSLAEKPNLISKLLISDVKVEVLISPLHESLLEEQASFITLGSPAYNAASKYLQDNHLSQIKFNLGKKPHSGTIRRARKSPINNSPYLSDENHYSGSAAGTANQVVSVQDDTGMAGPSGYEINFAPFSYEEAEAQSNKSEILIEGLPPFSQTTYGFIERINGKNLNRKIFYVAGTSELATAGAAYHLLTQWSSLVKKYGKDTPFIRMVSVDPTDYRKSSIIFDK